MCNADKPFQKMFSTLTKFGISIMEIIERNGKFGISLLDVLENLPAVWYCTVVLRINIC